MCCKALNTALTATLLVLPHLIGCNGSIGDVERDAGSPASPASSGVPSGATGATVIAGKTPDQVLATCTAPSPGRAPMRRLSNAEYRNTVSDLFANLPDVVAKVAGATVQFPSEPESLGFRNSADFLTVPALGAQKYLDAAQEIAGAAGSQVAALVPCSAAPGEACASEFIRSFGKRAYRRPLADDEVARYQALYAKAAATYDFATGIEWIVFSMLQSPQFLYRVELGQAGSGGAVTRPSPYEMASRLSYLYWQSTPDDALLAAAESGALGTQAELETQARRLLQDPRAARLLEYFDQWLDLDALQEFNRDASVYPGIAAELPDLLQQETHAFVSSLLADPKGNFEQLLTAPFTYANAQLAAHYGLSGPVTGAFEKVAAPGRAGVLSQGMMLAHDRPTRTSIVRRGLKIRVDFLCQLVPAPPPDVVTNLEGFGPGLTQRQRLEQHRTQASCASCHNLMDPIGVVFEGFDAVGRPRTVDETGAPVELSSTLTLTEDADGPIASPPELGARLAGSDQVRRCYATQSFRFFYGREVESADACSLARLLKDFQVSNYSLSELLVSLVRTDAFLYRPAEEVSP